MKTYVAIDLKSYYASAEAVARGMNPLTTNLVVADLSRTEKTICLAVSPSLKAYGIPGRARLFEVVQRVKEINAERFQRARKLGVLQKGEDGKYCFHGSSFDAEALAADPGLELAYLVVRPRMLYYEQLSTKIFSIYGRSVSPEDIHVYSIDECFIDLTPYLELSGLSAREFAMTLVRDVLFATGVTATAGIGTNMYLAKIAMDIVAKHVPPDRDGVRIAELDERSYREQLWCHRPLTDFWRVGPGIARRLEKHGLFTMGDVARQSVRDEDVLYKEFGVNAELLIDHAWGWEPSDMQTVRNYRPETTSLSSGQVLAEGYPFDKGRIIVREMTEALVLDLVRKGLVTKKLVLTVSYDHLSLTVAVPGETWRDCVYAVASTGEIYDGTVTMNYYGKPHPKHAHGTANLDRWSSSSRRIVNAVLELYDRIVDPRLLVRRLNIAAVDLIGRDEIPEELPKGVLSDQLSLFEQPELYTADEQQRRDREAAEEAADEKERRLQETTLKMQAKYGKNAVLRGVSYREGATGRDRNKQIGGHRSGEEDDF
ncbi:MAG: DNA methylase [Oscillospiraceae bacterium]|nr:DNA methylase [Oscillospiraceae bacterium]